jgi:hypothetical protein
MEMSNRNDIPRRFDSGTRQAEEGKWAANGRVSA